MKTINIKGKEYVPVNERLLWLASSENKDEYSIQTEIIHLIGGGGVWVVKATLTLGDNVYTGHAQEVEGEGYINKTSALENAETSAVGRACAMAGIGVLESVASADEVIKATNREI